MSLSNYAENALLNHILNTAYTPAATIYLALCTADPTDAATGASMNEVANSGSYARTAITFSAASAKAVVQNGAVTFPQASGSWGTVSHWTIVDTNTYGSGNVLAYGAFLIPKSVVSGNTPTVPTTTVTVTVSGNVGITTANSMLDLMFRNQAYSKPDTYLALTTVAVTDSMTGSTITEPSGNNYSRTQVNPSGGANPNWTSASSGAASNEDAITAPTPSGSWGTIVGCALVSAASAGTLLIFDNTNVVDQAVGSGDTVQFGAGDFDVSLN